MSPHLTSTARAAILFFLTLAVFAASPAAAADDWKTYRYPQDRFAAEFPTQPKPEDQKPDPQRMIRHTQYWSEQGDIAFGISVALFQHKVITSMSSDAHLRGVIERV